MRSTLQPPARAASTAKLGVSARTAQSTRGGSPAVSASVVVAITNACAICCYIATSSRKKKGAFVGQSRSSIRRASEAPLHHFAPVARGTREVPLMAALFRRYPSRIITTLTGRCDTTSVMWPSPDVSSISKQSPAANDRVSPELAVTRNLPAKQNNMCRPGVGCGWAPPQSTGSSRMT
jgi:hypothetical protein